MPVTVFESEDDLGDFSMEHEPKSHQKTFKILLYIYYFNGSSLIQENIPKLVFFMWNSAAIEF